jgi:hypothetical protein
MDMQHGIGVKKCTWTRSIDMEHGHAAGTSSMEKQQVHEDTFLKTLAFPPGAWIWALQPSFQSGRGSAKGGKSANSRSALSLFFGARRFRFFRARFSLHSCPIFFSSRS